MRRSLQLAGLAVLLSGALAIVGTPATAGGGGHCEDPLAEGSGTEVQMMDACFLPAVLEVGVDEDVTFTNLDPIAHNITPAGWGWGHIGELRQGDTYTARFDEAGVFPYACSLHPGMTGAVIVGDDTSETFVAGTVAPPNDGDDLGVSWVIAAGILGVATGLGTARIARRGARSGS